MAIKFNGRVIDSIEVDGVDPRDYPDFCDSYFSYAEYVDTGEPLDDDELIRLGDEQPELLGEMAFEHFM